MAMNKDEPLYNDQLIITVKIKKGKTGLLPSFESNYNNNKIMENELLLPIGGSNPFFTFREFEELLSSFGSISRKPSLLKLYFYFLKNRAATWQVLLNELKIPESSLARGLKELLKLGFIEQVTQFQAKRLGGPKPKVYAVIGCKPDECADVIQKHMKMTTPAYSLALRLAQLVLDEYMEPHKTKELSYYKELLPFLKGRTPGFQAGVVAQQVANVLSSKGIKVWK